MSGKLKASKSPTKSFKKALDEGVAEYGSSFSIPAYSQRWRSVKRYSQELLDEYLHHLISEPENAKGCHTTFCQKKEIRQRILKLSLENVPISEKDLDAMLRTILKKEGRVGKMPGSAWPGS
jgi:hypothetical protein